MTERPVELPPSRTKKGAACVYFNPLIRKLESIAHLTAEERKGLAGLSGKVRELRRGEDICRIGDRPSDVTLVSSGLLCRHLVVESGKRQITSFHIPGDMPDLHSLFVEVMDHNLGAVTASEVLTIPHRQVEDLLRTNPQLGKLLWRDTLIDAGVFREWVVNLAARPAHARIAHLLCEIITRMNAVGLTSGRTCALPLTQQEIGDATGLSTVHVNRTLQALRAENLIEIGHGALSVLDWERLAEFAEFDPTYLHLRHQSASRLSQPGISRLG